MTAATTSLAQGTGPILLAQGTSNPLAPQIGTFLAELFGFLIVLFVLWRYVVPPVRRSMEQRQQAIRDQYEDSRRARERAEQAEADYQQALADARREATRMREQAQEQRSQIVEEARTEAREQRDAILARAEEQVAAERDRAVRELRDELGRLAADLAERVVGESLQDSERQQRVVERFLDELERSPAGEAGSADERERVQ